MRQLLLMALVGVTLAGANATGKWTGTMTLGGDGRVVPALLVLKQDGDTVTGTAGADENQQYPIQNGKIDQGTVTFEVVTGNSTMKFALTQRDDDISGDVTRDHEGRTETAKLAAKRAP